MRKLWHGACTGSEPESHRDTIPMNYRLRHRERVRNAYLQLFALLILLPALLPVPLLFLK